LITGRPSYENIFFAIAGLLMLAIPVCAQTSSELEGKYGKPQKFYEVRPDVMMTVTFNDEGQACEMRVERHNATESTTYMNMTFYPQSMAQEIVDDLVPFEARGAKSKHSGLINITGSSGSRFKDYKNVQMTYQFNVAAANESECSGIVAIIIRWKNRGCKQK
jgi:hypothetical protein